jgi:hypothetical protein
MTAWVDDFTTDYFASGRYVAAAGVEGVGFTVAPHALTVNRALEAYDSFESGSIAASIVSASLDVAAIDTSSYALAGFITTDFSKGFYAGLYGGLIVLVASDGVDPPLTTFVAPDPVPTAPFTIGMTLDPSTGAMTVVVAGQAVTGTVSAPTLAVFATTVLHPVLLVIGGVSGGTPTNPTISQYSYDFAGGGGLPPPSIGAHIISAGLQLVGRVQRPLL